MNDPCDLEVAGPFTTAFEVVAQSYVPSIAVRVPILWIVVAGIIWRVRGVGRRWARQDVVQPLGMAVDRTLTDCDREDLQGTLGCTFRWPPGQPNANSRNVGMNPKSPTDLQPNAPARLGKGQECSREPNPRTRRRTRQAHLPWRAWESTLTKPMIHMVNDTHRRPPDLRPGGLQVVVVVPSFGCRRVPLARKFKRQKTHMSHGYGHTAPDDIVVECVCVRLPLPEDPRELNLAVVR